MLAWLAENIGTIITAILLLGVISFIIIAMIKDKKKGKSSCGCNCAHCAMADKCHKVN